jgi:NTE family protein
MITNIVFEGGGVKGIAYAGVIKALEQSGHLSSVQRVGGTSAGAIISLLICLNLSSKDISRVMYELNLIDFKDNKFGIFRDMYRLIKRFGWNKGEVFYNWCKRIIFDYTNYEDMTFKDLNDLVQEGKAKHLYLIGSNLSSGYSEIFSYETTPQMKVVDAVRISMSLPLFFSAYRHSITNDIYVDGGVFDNYPIDLFDDKRYLGLGEGYYFNPETLGFKLESSSELRILKDGQKPKAKEIKNFGDFIKSLLSALMNNEDNKHKGNDLDKGRTVYIDSLNNRFFIVGYSKKRII